MAAGGYRVELESLRSAGRRFRELSSDTRDSIGEPLAPPAVGDQGFASVQAAFAAAEAWTSETWALAAALRAAGDKLTETAAEYDRADTSGAHGFQRIPHGG